MLRKRYIAAIALTDAFEKLRYRYL